jgi:UDP-N-acetylmuramoyl-tripeptide--D-alanyl-D-alanine ligase
LDNFASIKADRKIIILGDMFELGQESYQEHKSILEKAMSLKSDLIIFIGKDFTAQRKADDNSLFFETTEEAEAYLKTSPIEDSTILIKGSRGMKLEGLAELL